MMNRISELHTADPGWYSSLTGQLTKEQQKEVQEVLVTADQRKATEGNITLIALQAISFICSLHFKL